MTHNHLRSTTFSPKIAFPLNLTSQVELFAIFSTSHVIPYLTGSARGRFRSLCRHALPDGERWEPFSLPLPSRFTSRGALGAVSAPSAVTLYLTGSAGSRFRSRCRHALPHEERWGLFSLPLASYRSFTTSIVIPDLIGDLFFVIPRSLPSLILSFRGP